jgi:hypothetical protein
VGDGNYNFTYIAILFLLFCDLLEYRGNKLLPDTVLDTIRGRVLLCRQSTALKAASAFDEGALPRECASELGERVKRLFGVRESTARPATRCEYL